MLNIELSEYDHVVDGEFLTRRNSVWFENSLGTIIL